jgi:hypothetical protein
MDLCLQLLFVDVCELVHTRKEKELVSSACKIPFETSESYKSYTEHQN